MDLTSQIKLSSARLSRDLSKNREKLSGNRDQQDKFSMEFRKALEDRDRISIRKTGKKAEEKEEKLESKNKDKSSKKLEDKDDSSSEKIESKDKKKEKTKSKEKTSEKSKEVNDSSNTGPSILPPKLDYGKDINPEFLDLINLDNKDIMIDEENQQIIILDDDLEVDPDLDMEVNSMKKGLMELSNEEGIRSQGREIKVDQDFIEEVESLKKIGLVKEEEHGFSGAEEGKLDFLDLEKAKSQGEVSTEVELEDELDIAIKDREGKVDLGENLESDRDDSILDLSSIERKNFFMDQMDMIDKTQVEKPNEILTRNLENIQGKIVENMETMVDGESSNIKLELYPRSLGNINIELTMENGKLIAKILVEDKSTRQMFLNNTSKLVENLNKENINLSKIDVSLNDGNNWSDASSNLDQSGEGFNHESQEDKTRQANLNFKRGRSGSNKQDTMETGNASLSDGGLDLLI